MNETAARRLSLACALESADARYALIPQEARKRFAQSAAAESDGSGARVGSPKAPLTLSEEALLTRRGELTLELIAKQHRQVLRAANGFRWSGWVSPALILICLLFGALMVEPGILKRMNILAYPLLGLIAWNVVVIALLLLRWLLQWVWRTPRPSVRALIRAAQPVAIDRWLKGEPTSELTHGLKNFAQEWLERSLPLNVARASRLLHWSAIALALGAIAGLYLRGIVFQFHAGWESTFLLPQHVHQILSFALAPASVVTGIEVPDVQTLEKLRFSPDNPGENAARWIHLYAVTTVLFVIIPRLLLALFTHWRVIRLREKFVWPTRKDPRIRRWLNASLGKKELVIVIPFGYTPGTEISRAIQNAAMHGISEQAEVQVREPLSYDQADSLTLPEDLFATASAIILLFSLATTPEREVHTVAIERVRAQINRGNMTVAFAVLIDEAPMRKRFEGQAELARRVEERRAAWRDAQDSSHTELHFEDLALADSAERDQRLGQVLNRQVEPSLVA